MKWYLEVLQKYAVFSGRAGREEYWMFFLFNMIAAAIVGFVGGMVHADYVGVIYQLGVLVPSIAVGVRRMHDTNRSGWWIIVPIAGLVFLFFKGDTDSNRFGAAP